MTFTKANPVTGANTTFTWAFTGSNGNWGALGNWVKASGDNPTALPETPGSNNWDPILFDSVNMPDSATKQISRSGTFSGGTYDVEGWNLRIGVFNGVTVTIKNLKYWTGGLGNYAFVDATSKLKISGVSTANWNSQLVQYFVAAKDGIEYTCAVPANGTNTRLAPTIEYYLTGDGSVSYQAINKHSTHKICQADIQLSAESDGKYVTRKPLVTWTSTANATFAAPSASIEVTTAAGATTTTTLTSILGSPTLTSANEVGSCELVQTTTGVYLYWVDYAPAVAFTAPLASDWSGRTLPTGAKTWNEDAVTTLSFGNRPEYMQILGDRSAIVANVTGGTYTEIDGLVKYQETVDSNKDIFLMVSGDTTSARVNGVGEADWQAGTRTFTGNVLVNLTDNATADWVMGAGFKGGQPTALTGDVGVVIDGNAVVKGTVLGGWSSVHDYKPLITGSTSVKVKNVQAVTDVSDLGSIPKGYIIGGSAYQGNLGRSNITKNTSVTIDLPNEAEGTFVKGIVGGSYGGQSGADRATEIGGSTSVAVTAPAGVTFIGNIIGACWAASGIASVAGDSSVTLDGGKYTGTICAGGYGMGSATVTGSATLALKDGVFTGATLMGGNATGAKTLAIEGDIDLSGATGVSGFSVLTVGAGNSLSLPDSALTIDTIDLDGGSTLTFNYTNANSPSLTASTAITVGANDTVKIALGNGAVAYDNAKIVSWSAAPDGTFEMAPGSNPHLSVEKTATGLVLHVTPVATVNGVAYLNLDDAIAAAGNTGVITLLDESIDFSETCVVVKDDDGNGHKVIRKKGDGYEVYYKSGYMGTDGDNNFKVTLSDKETETVINAGDVVVFDNDDATVWVSALLPVNLSSIKINGNVTFRPGNVNALLPDVVITIADNKTLTFERNYRDMKLASMTLNGGTVAMDNSTGSIYVDGAIGGTSLMSIGNGKTINITSTGSIANTLTGAGRVSYEALPPRLLFDESWTGTVALPAIASGALNVADYATQSSTVELTGAVGASVTVPAGYNVAVASGGSISGQITGSGKIALSTVASADSAMSFGQWTGTVVLPEFNLLSNGINFCNYGIASSTVEIIGDSKCWLKTNAARSDEHGHQPRPNIKLTGSLSISGSNSGTYYRFYKVSGTGRLSFTKTNTPAQVLFDEVVQSSPGDLTLVNDVGIAFTITKLTFPVSASAELFEGQKLLSVGGEYEFTNPDIEIEGMNIITGTIATRRNKGEATDGLYLELAETEATPEEGSTSAIAALPANYVGSVVVPPQVATLTTTGTAISPANVKVKFGENDITGAFTIGGSAGNVTIALNPEGSVGEVPVRPVPADASPVTFAEGATTPSYTVKAIPGLWYKVRSGTALNGTELGGTMADGEAVQASGETVSPVAPAFPSGESLQYHKIAVDTTNE